MKFAVISDIHANAIALQLVLDAIRNKHDTETIYCTGDVVGFHTSPGECIDLLREHNVFCIAGNHDAGVVGKLGKDRFPTECWEAIQWTKNNLNKRQLDFLSTLPSQTIVDKRFWLMHGIFGDPYHYLTGKWKTTYAFLRLKLAGIYLAFYGHTHRQSCLHEQRSVAAVAATTIEPSGRINLDADGAYLVNPGTVGHPRTQEAAARYVIVDVESRYLGFEHVPYDYTAVVEQTLSVFPRHVSLYARFQAIAA